MTMKRIITIFAALALCGATAFAQNLEEATNATKAANEALVAGNYDEAAAGFRAALDKAVACNEAEAEELANTCKTGLTQSIYAAANDLVKNNNLEQGLVKIEEAIAAAKEYGISEIEEKATDLKYQIHQAIYNTKMKAAKAEKDAAAKAAYLKEALEQIEIVLANDPENGNLILSKGQVQESLGKYEEAIATYTIAKEKGLQDKASRMISKVYLKIAQAKMKAGDLPAAIEYAKKSNEESPNANACKIAGISAQKLKDYKTAVAYLQKYLELAPSAKDADQIKTAIDALKAQIK